MEEIIIKDSLKIEYNGIHTWVTLNNYMYALSNHENSYKVGLKVVQDLISENVFREFEKLNLEAQSLTLNRLIKTYRGNSNLNEKLDIEPEICIYDSETKETKDCI